MGIRVRNIVLGEGRPKVCAPLVGSTLDELVAEARDAVTSAADVVEWRADRFTGIEAFAADVSSLTAVLRFLRGELRDLPLLFTFRTITEGGAVPLTASAYAALGVEACRSGLVDLVDVELFADAAARERVLASARENGVASVVSNHDFERTPPKAEILRRLVEAAALGDIPKIAVMPRDARDVLTLLEAALDVRAALSGRPLIALAMGGLGLVSRLGGEPFGSALSFASLRAASAPGQVPVAQLRAVLDLVHGAIELQRSN